ncbi:MULTISPECIES: hypothetical protein [Pseudomonas]|uniref:Uncharacterized protein n=1 Tax=Pseudomonas synxantha TaxID=47883 RepID=A0A5D3GAP9_9PSED|nr:MULTISPECIES: hypothetical protein [Pseudomonas]MBY8972125.1 hypothetical protein [Pseudomonas sp. P867]MCK3827162.1 hypothetical protein [Pseudomonas sp. W2Aug9]MCK3831255.1 hypothetical protein [Pseudomonas fluorescens]MCK3841607.1 hypothetical protein [Pseudomonas sp. NCIMB 10586]MCK3844958.1 hypothetical protein [Pseudomonas sp. W15Feb34]
MDFFLAYTAVMIIGTFVVLGLILFFERTKLDELEGYFSENPQVRKHRQRWGRNQRFIRFHRMCLMIDILRAPESSVKEGFMTEAESAAIPSALRRWAVWPYRLAMIWAISWGYWCTWL